MRKEIDIKNVIVITAICLLTGCASLEATEGIAGVMLDHDLDQQPMTATDLLLSVSNLIESIVFSIPRAVPILIHSMNTSKPQVMQKRLTSEGFSVTRIRMTALTRKNFHKWLQDVRDNWEESV